MPTDAKPIRLYLDADPRLAAGAGGAAHYFAENAGMPHEAASELQTAIIHACTEAFDSLSDDVHLELEFAAFADRVEIAISHEGGPAPAIGLDTIVKTSGKALAGVDRVQYEQLGKSSVTRLTKYIRLHS